MTRKEILLDIAERCGIDIDDNEYVMTYSRDKMIKFKRWLFEELKNADKEPCEDKLIQYVKSKCYEVGRLKGMYEYYNNIVIGCCHDLETGSTFWVNRMGKIVDNMNKCYNQYTQGYRDISQLCHLLGGDYLELFKNVLESEENNDSN